MIDFPICTYVKPSIKPWNTLTSPGDRVVRLGGFVPSLKSIIGASVVGEIQVVPKDHGVDDRFQQGSVELLPASQNLTNDSLLRHIPCTTFSAPAF